MNIVIRHTKPSSNTGDKLAMILAAIRDGNVTNIVLFATPTGPTENYSDQDGPETNLPWVAALVNGTFIQGIALTVVVDGPFLTAVRIPRYLEVKKMMDEAEASDKVFFSRERAPFTSSLSPEAAAAELAKAGPVEALTSASRTRFFSLLSNVTESALNRQ